ncbi:non-hydrolyzing UDP-N-acetylglucosamine 2-epimerase [Peribacillus sp. SCS-37]|uniref:non-hydrolyzing UDP-N-acetylglucosamine 2-epimerase n=1 Tax=Paraperibacillus esterisolvens TaxID=3115296 RepID=UPI00390650DE
MKKIVVLSVFGTRPEAIKMAPLIKELEKCDQIVSKVCVTAQHREMLDQVLEFFQIKPDYDLDIMEAVQTLTGITTKVLNGMSEVIGKSQPDIILVHGDTTTTFAASLSAFYHHIPIGHVEAGLRTYNKYSPFPEEINRQFTDRLATLHFAPTRTAADQLKQEFVSPQYIFTTGNTVIDAMKSTVKADYQNAILERLQPNARLVFMTVHRRENHGDKMENIFRAIRRSVEDHKDIELVFPVHLNPIIQHAAKQFLGEHPRIHLTPPLDVIDTHNIISRSNLVLTDSGGIQEEAPSFGVPVLVLRDTTERPEGIEAGTLKLIGTDQHTIYQNIENLLTSPEAYQLMSTAVNPYGDGQASKRIVEAIVYYFGKGQRPNEFQN